jgi:hypothetical protein
MALVSAIVRPFENACSKRNHRPRLSSSQQRAMSRLGREGFIARCMRPKMALTVCKRIVALHSTRQWCTGAYHARIRDAPRDLVLIGSRVVRVRRLRRCPVVDGRSIMAIGLAVVVGRVVAIVVSVILLTVIIVAVILAIVRPDIASTVVLAVVVEGVIIAVIIVLAVVGPAVIIVAAIVVGGALGFIDGPRLVSVVLVVVRRSILAPLRRVIVAIANRLVPVIAVGLVEVIVGEVSVVVVAIYPLSVFGCVVVVILD